ncbi:MAG: GNAT family N-acetyltransferase [Acidobacteriota bacterium]|nr:GNAT family N-acetyltransferase [Acidobacteriota bacterium]
MTEIETARLRYRMVSPNDLDDLFVMFGDPEIMKYLGPEAGTTLSREDSKITIERMMEFWAEHGFGRWAVVNKEDGRLIGLAGFRLLDGTPELFYMFAKANWGKGLATEAARATLRYGFEELGFERIVAAIRPANTASRRVMAKIGLRYEKEITHAGIGAMLYVATRDEYQLDDSPYILSRA